MGFQYRTSLTMFYWKFLSVVFNAPIGIFPRRTSYGSRGTDSARLVCDVRELRAPGSQREGRQRVKLLRFFFWWGEGSEYFRGGKTLSSGRTSRGTRRRTRRQRVTVDDGSGGHLVGPGERRARYAEIERLARGGRPQALASS